MTKTFRNPENVHAPVANYTHQVEVGSERLLILSGQIGVKEDGTVPEDALEQLGVALDNVFRNLDAADMKPRDLLKLTFYHVGEIDSEGRRKVVSDKLKNHKPCMTLLFVAALATPRLKVEIEAMASSSQASA